VKKKGSGGRRGWGAPTSARGGWKKMVEKKGGRAFKDLRSLATEAQGKKPLLSPIRGERQLARVMRW